MSEDLLLKCLIAFVLGYLVARMMRGNGMSVGAAETWSRDLTGSAGATQCDYSTNTCCNERDQCWDI